MKLRYYQHDAVVDTISSIDDGLYKKPVIVLPTGAGKTLVISNIVDHYHNLGKSVLVLSHVKEILEQNHSSIKRQTGLDIGMYSAMVGIKFISQTTVAGVQSAFRNAGLFSHFDIVIIDECHLVSDNPDSMYQKLLSCMPNAILIGLTATPYRLGSGYIYRNGTFDGVSYDGGSKENYKKLVDNKFLSPIRYRRTALEMDTSGIKMIGGDYSEKDLSNQFDRKPVTEAAVKEIMAAGKDIKCWLVFAIDIDHAEHIAEVLIRNGVPTAVIHSKMKDSGFDRDTVIEGYKNGKYKCIVNVNILTTGFDHPDIGLVACLRPTQSPTLHVQSIGRGSRVSEDKDDCLVLDFSGNTARLGTIDDVLVKEPGGAGGTGEPVCKACPDCDAYVHASVRICPECNHKFSFKHGLSDKAFSDLLKDGKPHWVKVDDVQYEVARKFGNPSTVKVNYKCGTDTYSEWVCIEHAGFARHKANHWVKYRGVPSASSAEELFDKSSELKIPYEICVQKKGKYNTVINSNFN